MLVIIATTLSRTAGTGLHHAAGDAAGKVVLEESQDCRTTCQWFCQRIRFDRLAAIAWLESRFCVVSASGQHHQQRDRHREQQRPVLGEQSLRGVGRDQRDHAADEDRYERVEQGDHETGYEQRSEQPFSLPGVVLRKPDQRGRWLRPLGCLGRVSRAVQKNENMSQAQKPAQRRRRCNPLIYRIGTGGREASCRDYGLDPAGAKPAESQARSEAASVTSQIAPSGPWRTSRTRSRRPCSRRSSLAIFSPSRSSRTRSGSPAPRQQVAATKRETGCRYRMSCRRSRSMAPSASSAAPCLPGGCSVNLRTAVVDAVADHRPAVILARLRDVDLVAAARTVLCPERAGRGCRAGPCGLRWP